METCRIYLSGAMSGLSFEEQTKWRSQIVNAIKFGDFDYEKKPLFFDPTQYFGLEEVKHCSEREAMEFDLNALRKSDLVIVNFNNPLSLGTCAELAVAYEMKIPVIGINIDSKELHPWLIEFTSRMCDSLREAVEYTVDFYLN